MTVMNYRTQSFKLPETLTGDGEPQPNLILGQGSIHQTFWGDDVHNKQRNYNQREYLLEAISEHATIMYSQRQPFSPIPSQSGTERLYFCCGTRGEADMSLS